MFDRSSTFGEALDNPAARAVLETFLPGIAASPMAGAVPRRAARAARRALVPALRGRRRAGPLLGRRSPRCGDGAAGRARRTRPRSSPIPTTRATTCRAARRGGHAARRRVPRWGVLELRLDGPVARQPVRRRRARRRLHRAASERSASAGSTTATACYVIRLLAEAEGGVGASRRARPPDRSTASTGTVVGGRPAAPAAHGPVRVDGFHFAHADGTRHRPLGTTAYAWTHQSDELQEQTLATLAESRFTKMRMCLFPKSYLYNANEPDGLPLPRLARRRASTSSGSTPLTSAASSSASPSSASSASRPTSSSSTPTTAGASPTSGRAVDDRFLRYVVRRLAAYANVWWSMANEYDLLWSKTEEDWERLAAIVERGGPVRAPQLDPQLPPVLRLLAAVDHARQRAARRRLPHRREHRRSGASGGASPSSSTSAPTRATSTRAGATSPARRSCAASGRAPSAAATSATARPTSNDARGAVVVEGRRARGHEPRAHRRSSTASSPRRPTACSIRCPPTGTCRGAASPAEYLIGYFGFNRPRFRNVVLPEGEFEVDVIDTWNMTVEPVPGVHSRNRAGRAARAPVHGGAAASRRRLSGCLAADAAGRAGGGRCGIRRLIPTRRPR